MGSETQTLTGSTVKAKGRVTKTQLPDLMRNNREDKFTKVVLPSLLLWYGDHKDVWSISEEELLSTLKAIVKVVYPAYGDLDMITHRSTIYGLVRRLVFLLASNSLSALLVAAGTPTSQLLASQHRLDSNNSHI